MLQCYKIITVLQNGTYMSSWTKFLVIRLEQFYCHFRAQASGGTNALSSAVHNDFTKYQYLQIMEGNAHFWTYVSASQLTKNATHSYVDTRDTDKSSVVKTETIRWLNTPLENAKIFDGWRLQTNMYTAQGLTEEKNAPGIYVDPWKLQAHYNRPECC